MSCSWSFRSTDRFTDPSSFLPCLSLTAVGTTEQIQSSSSSMNRYHRSLNHKLCRQGIGGRCIDSVSTLGEIISLWVPGGVWWVNCLVVVTIVTLLGVCLVCLTILEFMSVGNAHCPYPKHLLTQFFFLHFFLNFSLQQVARLKLKEIDGRAPPGKSHGTKNFDLLSLAYWIRKCPTKMNVILQIYFFPSFSLFRSNRSGACGLIWLNTVRLHTHPFTLRGKYTLGKAHRNRTCWRCRPLGPHSAVQTRTGRVQDTCCYGSSDLHGRSYYEGECLASSGWCVPPWCAVETGSPRCCRAPWAAGLSRTLSALVPLGKGTHIRARCAKEFERSCCTYRRQYRDAPEPSASTFSCRHQPYDGSLVSVPPPEWTAPSWAWWRQ